MKTSPILENIRIRMELKPGDLGFVTYLHGLHYHEECGYGVEFEAYVALGLHEFHEKYDPTKSRVWLCEQEERIVGSLALMSRGDSAQLRYFLIDPAFRGIGLGKKLMALFIDFMKQCGYRKAYLLTTNELPTAAHLYTSHGFRLSDEKATSVPFGKPVIQQRYDLLLE